MGISQLSCYHQRQTPISMNDLRNLECFSMATRGILRRLLEDFPKPVELDSMAIQRELVSNGDLAPDCAWENGSGSLVDSTIAYLVTEGVIRSTERRSVTATEPSSGCLRAIFVWDSCSLTAAGFAALNRDMPGKQPLSRGKSFAAWIATTGKVATQATSAVQGISNLLSLIKSTIP